MLLQHKGGGAKLLVVQMPMLCSCEGRAVYVRAQAHPRTLPKNQKRTESQLPNVDTQKARRE